MALIRRPELPFEWECFYHVDDFAYCVRNLWEAWLVIWLVFLLVFLLVATLVVIMRRRRRKREIAEARRMAREETAPSSLRIPDIP